MGGMASQQEKGKNPGTFCGVIPLILKH
jgi:hypothetical protein